MIFVLYLSPQCTKSRYALLATRDNLWAATIYTDDGYELKILGTKVVKGKVKPQTKDRGVKVDPFTVSLPSWPYMERNQGLQHVYSTTYRMYILLVHPLMQCYIACIFYYYTI